jgi:hypothetical protein
LHFKGSWHSDCFCHGMKNLFLVLISIFSIHSTSAFAQYSCADLPNIQAILAQLQQNCGTNPQPQGFCRAKGYIGNTAAAAIAACSASGTPYGRDTCVADLTCSGNVPGYCEAKGYIGNSMPETIAACSASGTPYGRDTCVAAATCHGIVPSYCMAKGYIGNSAEETIAACSASGTPYGRETCVNDLVCR